MRTARPLLGGAQVQPVEQPHHQRDDDRDADEGEDELSELGSSHEAFSFSTVLLLFPLEGRMRLNLVGGLGEYDLGRQALQARGAVEAVAALAALEDELRVLGVAIGPWQSTSTSGFTLRAAAAQASIKGMH